MARYSHKSIPSYITVILNRIRKERQRRRRIRRAVLILFIVRLKFLILIRSILSLLLANLCRRKPVQRSCCRLLRNEGWWDLIYRGSDDRFKKSLRVTRETFYSVLNSIRKDIEKDTITEVPISPECRLAICLYRLGRGEYLYTIAELFGIGVSTVHNIVIEVSLAIVKNLWKSAVMDIFPSNSDQITAKIIDMEQLWQFPCAWGAVDGCHLPIVCPNGGQESRKGYHNFKNFYSIVMMAIVDAKDRFVWVSIGFPGNSHDSVIFQSTQLWTDITEKNIIPSIGKNIEKVTVNPLLLGDSAFPFRIWLMKPYGHDTLSPKESNFNYHLSRARMVAEQAFCQLKSRWRILLCRSECEPESVKVTALACVFLHNLCIANGDILPQHLDLVGGCKKNQRDREKVRKLLQMRSCTRIKDSSVAAETIRAALTERLWKEKKGEGVL